MESEEPEALPSAQPGDSSDSLTLDDLEHIAAQSNPTLVQASMAVRAAEGRYTQAGLYPNPGLVYIGDEIGNGATAGLQGGGILQEFVTAGKLRLGRAVASREVQQARYAWESQLRRVFNDVRAGYYRVLVAQKTVEVNEQLVRIGNEGVEVTEKLRAAREVSQADVLQARIEAETVALGLQNAKIQHRAAWRQLAAVLGQPEMDQRPLRGEVDVDLPELKWQESLTQLLSQSPELAEARAGVQRARHQLALQCARRYPNFQIGSAVKYDDGSHFTVVDVEFGVRLPLYNRNQGNITQAHSQLVAARNEVRRVELDLGNRMAAAFNNYESASVAVESYRVSILPDAKASLELVSTGYREGEFGYLRLLAAQLTYFGVNLAYLENLGQLWASTVRIEGLLLSGGLQWEE